jgi:hypothetical protein
MESSEACCEVCGFVESSATAAGGRLPEQTVALLQQEVRVLTDDKARLAQEVFCFVSCTAHDTNTCSAAMKCPMLISNRDEQLRTVQFSWEELKRVNDSLNEQITRKDQYAGKLKHLLEKGQAQRLEQSDQIMSVQNDVHMMSLPPLPC